MSNGKHAKSKLPIQSIWFNRVYVRGFYCRLSLLLKLYIVFLRNRARKTCKKVKNRLQFIEIEYFCFLVPN